MSDALWTTLGEGLKLANEITSAVKEGRYDEAERKRQYLKKALEAFDRGDLSGIVAALGGLPIPESTDAGAGGGRSHPDKPAGQDSGMSGAERV